MILVLDTDVVVAAMRSPTGASAAILTLAAEGRLTLAATVALALEYEAVCRRPAHLAAAGLSLAEAGMFLDAVIGMALPVEVDFNWRPQVHDPNDELVLEAAINGRAEAIVTFNTRHFAAAPARFGIATLVPSGFLRFFRDSGHE